VSDWYFTNGNSIEGVKRRSTIFAAKPLPIATRSRSGINAFLIARDTDQEAKQVLHDIIAHADVEAVNAFGDAV